MKQEIAVVDFLNAARRGSPVLWQISTVLLISLLLCLAMQTVDTRLLGGVSGWEKPAKFSLSFLIQAMTLAWAVSLLQWPARGVATASKLFVAAVFIEMTYMVFRASRGEASHFNVSTTFAATMYAVMGVASLFLVGTSAFIGWRIWQQRGTSLTREATGVGLMLGALLGTVAGAYLSSFQNHWIGGDMTDATGVGFFHWSTTGGDLRVSHFIGLHAMQIVPLAALSGEKRVVYAVALLCAVFMAATFVMAMMGIPLLRG
jgi:hypothetical protein